MNRANRAPSALTIVMRRVGARTAVTLAGCDSPAVERSLEDAEAATRFARRLVGTGLAARLEALAPSPPPFAAVFAPAALTLAVWRGARGFRYRLVDHALAFETSGRWNDGVEDLAAYLDELWTFHAEDWQWRTPSHP